MMGFPIYTGTGGASNAFLIVRLASELKPF